MTLQVARFPECFPGQFIHLIPEIALREPRVLTWAAVCAGQAGGEVQDEIIIRRAYSIAEVHRTNRVVELDVIYRVTGKVTTALSRLGPGGIINVLGPLGNHYAVHSGKRCALLVAGGVGVPALLWWARSLAAGGLRVLFFVGARSADLVPLRLDQSQRSQTTGDSQPIAAELTAHGIELVVATDDGSLGHAGLVTEPFERFVEAHAGQIATLTAYTCGPEPMMAQVATICARWDLDGAACLERSMACGMGTCQSCVVPVRDTTAPDGWRYRLCCTDGPIFDCREVCWSHGSAQPAGSQQTDCTLAQGDPHAGVDPGTGQRGNSGCS